jgi:hypothetical protein
MRAREERTRPEWPKGSAGCCLLYDFTHLTLLKDARCLFENLFVQYAPTHDPSVDRFDQAVYSSPRTGEPIEFMVEVSGVYSSQRANALYPGGSIAIEKVWSFKSFHGDWRTLRPCHFNVPPRCPPVSQSLPPR